jgi:hypothetical protein
MGLPLAGKWGGVMIKRKQRVPMLDLSTLSGEDAETAVKHRVNGRDLNLFYSAETPASSVRLCARVKAMNSLI